VLDPGRGKTKTGYLWTLARDDRRCGGADPPAVVYAYAPERGAEHPQRILEGFSGVLQVDGYAAYKTISRGRGPDAPLRTSASRPAAMSVRQSASSSSRCSSKPPSELIAEPRNSTVTERSNWSSRGPVCASPVASAAAMPIHHPQPVAITRISRSGASPKSRPSGIFGFTSSVASVAGGVGPREKS
jgi:hypothetical protein